MNPQKTIEECMDEVARKMENNSAFEEGHRFNSWDELFSKCVIHTRNHKIINELIDKAVALYASQFQLSPPNDSDVYLNKLIEGWEDRIREYSLHEKLEAKCNATKDCLIELKLFLKQNEDNK